MLGRLGVSLFALLAAGAGSEPACSFAQSVDVEASMGIPDAKKCPEVARAGRREAYHLPAPEGSVEGISFATDWDRLQSGGWSGRQVMDGCRIRPDGSLTWHGKTAVRVEVQPKDDPLDLNANSERAEMLLMQDSSGNEIRESAASGIQYYATSYLFPRGWHGQQLPWSAFAPTDCTAEHQNLCNSWSFVWQFYGWGALSAAQMSVNGPQIYSFNNSRFSDSGEVRLGKWTDFVFKVDWSTGVYVIWRRDEGEERFRQVLIGSTRVPFGRSIYVKQGLYRGGHVGGRTDVLWVGPTVRGSTFSAVERQAFGTDGGGMDVR